ncbi:protein ecdysoneless [Cephus cinctus]|uniref:Protein ecdysoneless n=1 Tax=Cephus cinctus TaxID=211228 RepID=A0AAJ7BJ99_CEPCN|nr:protein ecdysoneless [Cephus cinctus]
MSKRMANTVTSRNREDDVLECFLYPKFCYDPNSEQVTETTLFEEIEKYKKEIAKYTDNYIWHRDPLVFCPKTKRGILLEKVLEGFTSSEESQIPPHIFARLCYDEDVGDEWFTVFLVFKLTQTFDGLIARLVDADGEFLLIEAANVLPPWADPETCQDRVFIRDGAIHAIKDRKKSLIELLKIVNERPQVTKMSDQVQAAIKKRLEVYPDEIEKRKHKARAYLPEKAASILHQEPGLISSAIRTICHSDPFERKVCRAMRYFPPEQRIMVNVKMTKCLYAMATHCRYTGDPRTGWNLPPTNSSNYNAHLLGVKIACGLELLVASANDEYRRKGGEKMDIDNDLEWDFQEVAWKVYLKKLESSGYFKDLLEGSQERDKLLRSARYYFLEHSNVANSLILQSESDAHRVLTAWKNVQTCDIEMQAQDEASLSPADSDSWLNVDPAQLEMMLGQHYGGSDKKRNQEPLGLREKVQSFLNQKSDIDGVQFQGDLGENEDMKTTPEEHGRIDFDSDVFDSSLRDILDLVVPGSDSEFEGSSEGSLGGDDEDRGGEFDNHMRLLDSQLQRELKDGYAEKKNVDTIEANLKESIEEEAGGSGPAGNIIGGPIRRLMHLQLQSPTTVPPDLQS